MKRLFGAFDTLLGLGMGVAGVREEEEGRAKLVRSVRSV